MLNDHASLTLLKPFPLQYQGCLVVGGVMEEIITSSTKKLRLIIKDWGLLRAAG